jgi:hypothetical protein
VLILGAAQGFGSGGEFKHLDVSGAVILKKSGGPARTPALRRKIRSPCAGTESGHAARFEWLLRFCGSYFRILDFPTSTGRPEGTRSDESFSLVSPYSSVSKPQEDSPHNRRGKPGTWARVQLRTCTAFPLEIDMHDTKERLSVLQIFAFLNYQHADVLGSETRDAQYKTTALQSNKENIQ